MALFETIFLVSFGVISFISLSSSYGIKRYPSNRMLDFDWPEPDKVLKKIPHEKYCHYYYKHESGELFTVRKCPTGEMFDYRSHECQEKHTAKCWSHYYGKNAVHDHIHSKWRKNFKCPFPNGNYPDIYDCDKYIVCLDGTPHFRHCSPNQQFDKIRRHCVYTAFCANVTDIDLVKHMCPYSHGNFVHLEDCSKYYLCVKNEPVVSTCEENKLFDERDGKCKDKESVRCRDRHNPYYERTSSVTNMKSATTSDFTSPTISDVSAGSTESVESSSQSASRAKMSPYVDETISVVNNATDALVLQSTVTEKLSSTPSENTKKKVDNVSETSKKSYFSTNTVRSPTVQTVENGNSYSTMSPSNKAESTVNTAPTY